MALHCKADFPDKEKKSVQLWGSLMNTPKLRISICLPYAKNQGNLFLCWGGKKPHQKKTPPKLSPKSEIPQLEGGTVIPNNKWEPVRSHQCSWIITNIAQENQIPWRVWCFLQIYSFAGYSSRIWYQLSQQTETSTEKYRQQRSWNYHYWNYLKHL